MKEIKTEEGFSQRVKTAFCPACQKQYEIPNETRGTILCSCGMESKWEQERLVLSYRSKNKNSLSWETDSEEPERYILKIGGMHVAELFRGSEEECWTCIFRYAVFIPEVKFIVTGQTAQDAQNIAADHIRNLLQTMLTVSETMLPAFS